MSPFMAVTWVDKSDNPLLIVLMTPEARDPRLLGIPVLIVTDCVLPRSRAILPFTYRNCATLIRTLSAEAWICLWDELR